jgi:hypothetical protein
MTNWAWPVASVSNTEVALPDVGEGVFVAFEGGDPSFPLWIGLFSGTTPTSPINTPFIVAGGTLGTQPTFSGPPLFTGSYARSGDLVHFQIQVDMDNITGFGTGQYYLTLPFAAKYPYYFRDGCLHDISTNREYTISGHVAGGATQLLLRYTGSNGHEEVFEHNKPVTLSTADNFHIAGTYVAV